MKKLLLTLALFALVATSQAQTITYIATNDYIGNSRETINANFSNLLADVQPAFSNISVFTLVNTSAVDFVGYVSNSVNGLIKYYHFCSTNGSSGDGNTPQGPRTNWIAGATFGVSNGGTYGFADTNTVLFTLGTNRFEVQGGASTPTNLTWNGYSLINTYTPTNAFDPTPLVAGAGYTVTVVRTGANLFSITATSTPMVITFSGWTTGVVGSCRVEVEMGTNTLGFNTNTVTPVGRAGSTNVFPSTTRRTALLFDKAIGESAFNVITLSP